MQPLAKSTAACSHRPPLWFLISHKGTQQTGKFTGMCWNKSINLSYRCLFPIFGQPLLTARIWRRERTFNEHHARRLLFRVSSKPQPSSQRHTLGRLTSSSSVFRTLLAGGMGSLMLDWYGWESIFYVIGALSGVWALVVWQFFLTGR